jgi:hypothetical protein
VQLSRARQDTRLYVVVGPEPQGAGELDLPDRDQPDAYLQLAQALSRAGGQTLAIDTQSSPDLQRLSTAKLRAERDRLRRQLDQAPRDRSRELARASAHRQQAEEALAAHQHASGGQPGGMLRWLRRSRDQSAQLPGGLAVATQQANRAHDRERELRQHQQRRHGWLEANAHLGPQYRQVVRTLAWQRRATGLAVEQERPGYVLDALGPVPESTRGRRAWRQAAAEIERYRRTYQVTDPDRALGPAPHDQGQRADRQRARTAIERFTPSSAPTAAATPSRPGSPPSSRDLTSSVAEEVPSGPPASTTRKESQCPCQAVVVLIGAEGSKQRLSRSSAHSTSTRRRARAIRACWCLRPWARLRR